MKRNVYLHEYKDMTFKERLYIVRNNDLKLDINRYSIENPLDWSLRMIIRACIDLLLVLILRPILYWPLALMMAKDLKTRFSNESDKTWFHSNIETMK